LGDHSEEILTELGFDRSAIRELVADEIVMDRRPL
jgi:hypothetical protein